MELDRWGWNDHFAEAFASACHPPEAAPGRVVSGNRGIYRLRGQNEEITARLSGAFNGAGAPERPVTGDWVALDPAGRLILALLPRRTRISRKKAGRNFQEQVLAANVDVIFIVTGLDGDFKPSRLERYMLLAQESGAWPVIVLNKSDLCEDPLPKLRYADRIAAGAPVVLMSALDADSAAQLGRHVETTQTAVVVGSSGVGKSTIVNHLLGAEAQAVREVRASDSRGRHTTTSRELFRLGQGWLLIDTPGLRELEPWAGPEAVGAVFGDIEALAAGCRFRDCRHEGEPGCAVELAVQAGALDEDRLSNMRKLRREMDHLTRMQDQRAALEHKRMVKRFHRAFRKVEPRG